MSLKNNYKVAEILYRNGYKMTEVAQVLGRGQGYLSRKFKELKFETRNKHAKSEINNTQIIEELYFEDAVELKNGLIELDAISSNLNRLLALLVTRTETPFNPEREIKIILPLNMNINKELITAVAVEPTTNSDSELDDYILEDIKITKEVEDSIEDIDVEEVMVNLENNLNPEFKEKRKGFLEKELFNLI